MPGWQNRVLRSVRQAAWNYALRPPTPLVPVQSFGCEATVTARSGLSSVTEIRFWHGKRGRGAEGSREEDEQPSMMELQRRLAARSR
ncbi:hypothetical protein Prum_000110 [Phytohabitans rumicis]|uniref:Uncharacterized protein n=1 Tax=Phytohabitans rumicis TaxID=1076125 RepID=A0A6V8KVP2_9ACTN|nr:hypothetical protein Prum_000110 [Phytohabitans rumicis]